MFICKVDLDILNRGRPAVESEDFVGQSDALLGGDVVDLLTRGTGAGRQILGTQLFLETAL